MTEVRTTEQQRTTQKTAPAEEQKHSEATRPDRSSGSTWAAQALLSGAPVWDMPRQSLAELVERVGNSGMLALASMRSGEAQTAQTVLTGSEPQTEAVTVPEIACPLAPVSELTAGTWPSGAFDPAGLA